MLLSLLFALQAPLAVRADTLHPLHDALDYDITVVVPDTGTHIVGQVQTTWRLGSDDPVRIELDSTFRVVRVLMDGVENSRLQRTMWGRDGEWVVVPHQKHAGDSLVTMVRYHGYATDGLVIRNNAYGARTAFSDNWPDRAHRWFPAQDLPADKATATFHVEVPAGLQVIANGTLIRIDSLPRGRTEWHYRIAEPIPVYTMVIGVAKFAVTTLPPACAERCVPMAVWTYPADSAFAVAGPFRRAGEIVSWFSQVIGEFPYERLTHVESTTIFGGVENASAIFYDEKAYGKHSLSESVVAHETAHQWFGDAVTEDDWHHLWLSEGFATYFSTLWSEHVGGDSARVAEMRRAATTVFGAKETSRPILDPQATNLMGLLNSNNYPKGAWVLNTLRGLVGDSAFFGGVREYYRQYRNRTALSADFARIMSTASGKDLDWYFRQALTQPGYPILDVRWREEHGGLGLTIRQVQDEGWGLFTLPGLKVLIDGKSYSVDVNGKETHTVLSGAPTRPGTIVIDPDAWWLVKSTVSGAR